MEIITNIRMSRIKVQEEAITQKCEEKLSIRQHALAPTLLGKWLTMGSNDVTTQSILQLCVQYK